MGKQFSQQSSYKWLNVLPDLVKSYNSTKHRTIVIKPKDVTAKNEAQILQRFSLKTSTRKRPKFKNNDKVRVSKIKQLFERGYTPN